MRPPRPAGVVVRQKGDVKQALKFIEEARQIDSRIGPDLLPGASVRPFGRQIEGYRGLRERFKKGQPPAMAQRNPT